MKNYINSNPYRINGIISYGLVAAGFVIISILLAGGRVSSSLQGQLVPICAYIVMAVSLNLVVGVSGELSLGHAGFMSVGAFSGVIAAVSLQGAVPSPVVRLVLAIVTGGFFAGIAGVIVGIPVLRLRGDYLAIVTLAFGEIIKNVINCIYVGVDARGLHMATSTAGMGLDGGTVIINGPMGATGIAKLSSFTAGFVLILFTLMVVLNLINSRHGRAIMAIRDNRIAAESVGLSVTRFKLMAFVTSAVLAGMAGALFALNFSTVAPSKFNFNTSILVLVFVVLGGMGNIWGSIIAATVLTILPETLRSFSDYRMLAYAIVLILVMLAANNAQFKAAIARVFGVFRKRSAAANGGAAND